MSMVVMGAEDESILTKDECKNRNDLNPRDDKTRETKCMFEPMTERGVVKSIKCCRHIESGKNSNFARVYVF